MMAEEGLSRLTRWLRTQPGRMSGIFLVCGVLWILFSDWLARMVAADAEQLTLIQTYKGWFFVLAATVLLHQLLRRQVTRRERADRDRRVTAERARGALRDAGRAEQKLEVRREQLEVSERRFRAMVENISGVVSVIDADATVQYVSPTVERVTGYPPEELLGRSTFEHVHPEDLDRTRAAYRRVLAEPDTVVATRARIRHADGSWRTVDIIAKNMVDDPAVDGIVVTYQDITQHVELERQLRQTQKLEAVGRLAGGIAHDFNNHMTVISGYVALLLQDLDPEDPRHSDLQEVKDATDRASSLTQQLLTFSRQQVMRPEVLDLNEVIEGTRSMLERIIGEDIEIDSSLASDLAPVRVDPGRLDQVLMNLGVNARDAMPDGGRLEIRTENAELDEAYASRFPYHVESGSYALLTVSDSGHGMDEATREQVFEPFFTTKDAGRGTGLGLSTVYGIVKQSAGYIWVDSAVGEGTTFRIYLPRVGHDVPEPQPREETAPAPGGSETILLAEDEPSVRRLIERILERNGYTVLNAQNGDEAMRIADGHGEAIDLVIADVVMPRTGGCELVRGLMAEQPGLPAILISGYAYNDADEPFAMPGQHDARMEGRDFVQKPVHPAALLRTVRDVLDGAA